MADLKYQMEFVSHPHGSKYNIWAKGLDEMYLLYEWDFVIDIEEITVWHFRITHNSGRKFDFYPMSWKLCNLKTKKWHQINPGNLKQFIKTFVDNEKKDHGTRN